MKWNRMKKAGTWTFFFSMLILNLISFTYINGCGDEDFDVSLNGTELCGKSTGLVIRILDGDTVELKDGRKIRYLHVDTPEISRSENGKHECFGEEAKELNTQLVLDRVVNLEYDLNCYDRFDRTLAFVSVDNRMVNKILVERGYGELMIISPNNKYEEEFEILEEEARKVKAGIWGICL